MTESFYLDEFKEGCSSEAWGNDYLDDYLNKLVFRFGLLDEEMEEIATKIYDDYQDRKDAWRSI